MASAGATPLVCPACGGKNAPDAVFCANPACRKALGEFRYVREEFDATRRWYEKVADRIADFVGRPQFLLFHSAWFVVWALLNTGLVATVAVFDEYPFGLLGIILSVEAIFITGFLLIASNRESTYANKCAELDYEVNVRTYRRVKEMESILHDLVARLERLETAMRPGSRT
jgi:uncharacterized membrane protein